MTVYDQQGNPLEEYDLDKGRLVEETRTVHHDAVEGVAEQSHLVVDREYPNGGQDMRRVIDVPGVEAQDAWDEDITVYVYIPWTDDEIAAQKTEAEKTQREARISELKSNLAATDYAVIKIAEGEATMDEYAPVIAQRREWREEINRLEEDSSEQIKKEAASE